MLDFITHFFHNDHGELSMIATFWAEWGAFVKQRVVMMGKTFRFY